MERETEKRISDLEREVRQLRLELNELKQAKQIEHLTIHSIEEKIAPKVNEPKSIPARNEKIIQSPKQIVNEPVKTVEKQPKKQRSFEEFILWALPKIFMIILVLGVLWGLKLISDYGLLSNNIKILLAYMLSIGLIIIAQWMEKKRSNAHVMSVALYGGSFIIGVLTTAAGAILYDVLSLYIALLITVIYIAYGIFISYLRKSEVLTTFVAFTSLLLPYLLEYMDFSRVIILAFILLVFGSIQVVILKHQQRVAIYIAFFFSILAAQIVSLFNPNPDTIFAIGVILLLAIFIASWWLLYEKLEKLKTLHEGLLFSLSGLGLIFINITADHHSEVLLTILAVLFVGGAVLAYKRKLNRVVDVIGTLAFITVTNLVLTMNLNDHALQILLPLTSFIGCMLALKLRAILMKVSYFTIFTISILIHLIVTDVEPFWSIDHLNYILILCYIILLYIYGKQLKGDLNPTEAKKINIYDFIPIFISIYFFAYLIKLDFAFISDSIEPYFVIQMLALIMVGSLFTPERFIGRLLPYAFIFAFSIVTINLLPLHYPIGNDVWMNLLSRFLYGAIIVAIVADIYMEGYIFKKWILNKKINIDGLMSIGIVASMLVFNSLMSQLKFDGLLNEIFVIASKTILLFITSSVSLWLSTTRKLRFMRIMGFILLAIAIIKLIFFDLSSLDLLIRAILFIAIGGIGLFLSNQLLKKI